MKTLSVEIERTRTQTVRFFVSVPDHWSRPTARQALTAAVIDEITDDWDWDNGEEDFRIAALYEQVGEDEAIDYAFPDEPAPPPPVQLSLPALETQPIGPAPYPIAAGIGIGYSFGTPDATP